VRLPRTQQRWAPAEGSKRAQRRWSGTDIRTSRRRHRHWSCPTRS